MCIQVVERYAVCGCNYYAHAVDPCGRVGSKNHSITRKETVVGDFCSKHRGQLPPSSLSSNSSSAAGNSYSSSPTSNTGRKKGRAGPSTSGSGVRATRVMSHDRTGGRASIASQSSLSSGNNSAVTSSSEPRGHTSSSSSSSGNVHSRRR